MIPLVSQLCAQNVSKHPSLAFEAILPSIERVAAYAFRRYPRWQRRELVADVVAAAYAAFVRLIERGLEGAHLPVGAGEIRRQSRSWLPASRCQAERQ